MRIFLYSDFLAAENPIKLYNFSNPFHPPLKYHLLKKQKYFYTFAYIKQNQQKTTAMKNMILLTMMLASATLFAQEWQWVGSAGGQYQDGGEIVDVDPDGNIVICGKFIGTVWFDTTSIVSHGDQDIFIAKYDSSGTFLWAQGAGGPNTDESVSVAFDQQGNVVFTGYFKQSAVFGTTTITGNNDLEFFVAKYGPDGTFQWVKKATGPGNDRGKGIDTDTKGNVLVTGSYRDTCFFGTTTLISPGDDNVFLAKYSPIGTLLWVVDGGGPFQAWTSTVSTDANDNAYITGSFKNSAQFGTHTVTSYGGNDVLLAKADSSGNWLWAVNAGGTMDDYGNGMEVDVFGNIAVTGSFFDTVVFAPAPYIVSYGSKDGFIAYYDANGNGLWANAMGGAQSDKGIACSTDKDGYVYVTGFVNGIAHFGSATDTGYGGDDIFLAKYDQNGNLLYETLAGSTGNDYGKGIQVDDQGVAYVTGTFMNTTHFGNIAIQSTGDRDIFLAKYYDGVPLLIQQPVSKEVCSNDMVSLTLQASGPGTMSYQWFYETNPIAGAVLDNYSFVASAVGNSGKYYCQVTNAYGTVTSDTAVINIYPLPDINFSAADSAWFFDTINICIDPGYASYLWSNGDTGCCVTQLYNVFVPALFHFSVTVTNTYGCVNSDSIVVWAVSTDVDDMVKDHSITVFPNPAGSLLFIEADGLVIRQIEIFDLSGMSVLRKKYNDYRVVIDTDAVSDGTFLVRITTNNGTVVKKLLML